MNHNTLPRVSDASFQRASMERETTSSSSFSSSSSSSSSNSSSSSPLFLGDMLENVLQFVSHHKDRNAVSLVCKAWYKVEAGSRHGVFIGNCYAVSPERLLARFPHVKSVTLKGKPRFADFDLVPRNWGAHVYPWIKAFSHAYPFLQELRLKRMTVSDESLTLIANSFANFKVLVLTSCDGFSTGGLAAIASSCKQLTELNLMENVVEDISGAWLSSFPDTNTSLVSLNFENLESEVDFEALEALVSRCKNLKTLKVNKPIGLSQLLRIMPKVLHLEELGTGSFSESLAPGELGMLTNSFSNCKRLRSLSGFWMVSPGYLSLIHGTCSNLTSLNLSYSPISDRDLTSLISCCQNIRRLWLLDSVEDNGLGAVGLACKDLEDFRVYPMNRDGGQAGQGVSEKGLNFISAGCPNLRSILFFCGQMTNKAVVNMAKRCPNLVSFRLCIMEPCKPDCETGHAMDEGFGAIVEHCKGLSRLALSGLLTDKVFEYIGEYGKQLERLSVAFAGESDMGMQQVLRGCGRLRKLEIRDSPFGDMALLSGVHRYESMRSLWMSDCLASWHSCTWLKKQKPRLNVEVIRKGESDTRVESVYVYRSLVGPRKDTPPFVIAL